MASQAFNCVNALGLAKRVAAGHRFNWKSGVWCRNDVKNKIYRPDLTLDHQVMFAHAAGLCGMLSEVDRFLSACETPTGFEHPAEFITSHLLAASGASLGGEYNCRSPTLRVRGGTRLPHLLFGLSLLRNFPRRIVFESERFVRAMRYFTMDMGVHGILSALHNLLLSASDQ